MPNNAMASVGRNLASFGIGQLRENFPTFSRKTLKVWLVPLHMSFFSSPQL